MSIPLSAPVKARRRSISHVSASMGPAFVRVRLVVEPPKVTAQSEGEAATGMALALAGPGGAAPTGPTPVLLKGSVKVKVLEAINLVNAEVRWAHGAVRCGCLCVGVLSVLGGAGCPWR
jgi:hypothetical protein